MLPREQTCRMEISMDLKGIHKLNPKIKIIRYWFSDLKQGERGFFKT
jgi:hypothetical protein